MIPSMINIICGTLVMEKFVNVKACHGSSIIIL